MLSFAEKRTCIVCKAFVAADRLDTLRLMDWVVIDAERAFCATCDRQRTRAAA
jgi:hypothetical protein